MLQTSRIDLDSIAVLSVYVLNVNLAAVPIFLTGIDVAVQLAVRVETV